MSLLLLLKAAAAGGGSGDGSQQLNADGAYILDADGNLYLKCCCGACPFCSVAPTAYDLEFVSVNDCPGDIFSPNAHTFHADIFSGDAASGCGWGASATGAGGTTVVGFHVDGTGASIQMKEFGAGDYFFSGLLAYGPDCSATIFGTNVYTSIASCVSHGGGSYGYGGNASAVPVMPP